MLVLIDYICIHFSVDEVDDTTATFEKLEYSFLRTECDEFRSRFALSLSNITKLNVLFDDFCR